MKLLHIDSSILADGSVSRELTAGIVARWKERQPGIEVITRDLAAAPLAHLSGSHFFARSQPVEQRHPEHQRDIEASDQVMEEFLVADIVVIGAPMYNFSVPSQLKAWIDRLAVAGKTFKYTAEGPVGLAGGKKIIVASSRGGFYGAGTPSEAIDFQEKYLTAIFGFMGVTDITFVRAEGLAMGPDLKQKALEAAHVAIAEAA
jgi:FMN-dependent NADH-azoreductase